MTTHRFIGRPTRSLEGPEKVSGSAKYAVDAHEPFALWTKLLRSPYPRARILRIDTTHAAALPGVHAILTGDDVRGMRTGIAYRDEPLLAWDEVRFAGERVAAVCAADADIATAALALIEVDYEELMPMLSAAEALAPGAPIIHPDFNSYEDVAPIAAPSNAYGHITLAAGDTTVGFADADVIVERTYETPLIHQMYFEPHTCLVSLDADGTAQVWLASGTPGINHTELARVLGISPDKIVVNFSLLGGSYGGKTDGTEAALCYLLAKRTGRSVRFLADYAEELTAMHPRNPSIIRIKAGAKRDGTLTAWEVEAYFATGAYSAYDIVPSAGGLLVAGATGPYRTPNVTIDSYQVYTNTIACGYMRGPGPFQCTFASESHVDEVAKALGMTPEDLRLKNLIHEQSDMAIQGLWVPPSSPDSASAQATRMKESLDQALEASGYREPKPANVGRGISIDVHGEIGGDAHAAVQVNADGKITISMPTYGLGIDTYTTLAQVVAEGLGVPLDRIERAPWSTAQGPTDAGLGGDRGARMITLVGSLAVRDVTQQLQNLAAELLGWESGDAVLEDGVLRNPTSDQQVPIAELVERAGHAVIGRGDADEPWNSEYASFVAHVAEVHVDPETGGVRLLRYTAVHETGQIINPIGFQGQINGGVNQGIAHALMEELPLDNGRVAVASFIDYKIPTMGDMPPLTTVILGSDVGHGQFNVRGIGNKAINMPAPAIANAIADATGVRVRSLPLSAEKVYHALHAIE
jgi:CO/xanthine dehydrogenase Mo-binding subunit